MTYGDSQSGSDGLTEEDADILAKTHRIFGNAEHGLTVDEIAEMLHLQKSSVRCYFAIEKRRIDLYRRLFVEDEAVKDRAIGILEARRAD